MNIHCRLCGYLASNAVTNCCATCDSTIAWAMNELRKKVPEWVTYNQAREWVQNGHMSQSDYGFFVDVWNIATMRLSVMESTKKESLLRLQKSRADNNQSR